MFSAHIEVRSHHFLVTRFEQRVYRAMVDFCLEELGQSGLVRVSRGRFSKKIVKIFADSTTDRTEFRFHRNCLPDLLKYFDNRSIRPSTISIKYKPIKPGLPAEFKIRDSWTAFDYQVPIIEYLSETSEDSDQPETKVLPIQTGKGKGFCSLSAVSNIGKRVLIVIKGMYVEKWIEELKSIYTLTAKDIMVVRGSADLKALIELGQIDAIDVKIIIITNKTLLFYFKEYRQYKNGRLFTYPCVPDDLIETIGAGVRLIDEVHQDFHLNFLIDLYTHVPKTISLSATLVKDDDPFITRMYEYAFPKSIRYTGLDFDKYIEVRALMYFMEDSSRKSLRWLSPGRKSYSHIVFEESVARVPKILSNYLNLIADTVASTFGVDAEPGQKMLIFCASIEFCTVVANHLKRLYPNRQVARYVGEDDYEVLLNNEIVVSTLLSAGTAVDIPGLRWCLMTTALGSQQLNLQAVGRLRALKKWPDVTPVFMYFVCHDIEQHVNYHDRKLEFLKPAVLSHKILWMQSRL